MLNTFIRSPFGMMTLLASAVGGPYVLYETEAGKLARNGASQVWQASVGNGSSSALDSQDVIGSPGVGGVTPGSYVGPAKLVAGSTESLWNYTTGAPSVSQLQQSEANQRLVGAPISDLRDVLRFDIMPGWVPQNFSRVSTVLSDVNMDGLRVPIVTGTKPTDLAGTLTYYFDRHHSLRRIVVHALTGDPSQLAQLIQHYYHLQPEPSLGGHLFTTRWNNNITSVMQIAPAPIMYATAQNSKYTVFIELNQPALEYGLSQEAKQLLDTGQQTKRW